MFGNNGKVFRFYKFIMAIMIRLVMACMLCSDLNTIMHI